MSTYTKIQWTDRTWNPVTGCSKVSPGCRNCYAEAHAHRFWGKREFTDRLPGPSRGAERNYPVLTHEDIERFPLPAIADDALLFLWRVASQVEEAYRVVRAWGFVPKTEIVWLKRTTSGKRWFGMGRIVRAEHEVCIVAKRSRPEILVRNIRSTFEARAGEHSEKPEYFYREIVEKLAAGPYVELFARCQRVGWTCLGNQTEHRTTVVEASDGAAKHGAAERDDAGGGRGVSARPSEHDLSAAQAALVAGLQGRQ
ncbi:MAG TPA: MT-A70 family methyltransferase [Candidatus Binataceae bacterium]|nr:MT-A70 family methyltransferase [Candidatus Binataceae bacterium]